MKHNVNLSEKDVKEYHTELSVLAGMLTFWGTACGLLVLVAVTIMQIYLSGFILSIGTFLCYLPLMISYIIFASKSHCPKCGCYWGSIGFIYFKQCPRCKSKF